MAIDYVIEKFDGKLLRICLNSHSSRLSQKYIHK